jgi:hypothetical protein
VRGSFALPKHTEASNQRFGKIKVGLARDALPVNEDELPVIEGAGDRSRARDECCSMAPVVDARCES